jgi:AIPR protein
LGIIVTSNAQLLLQGILADRRATLTPIQEGTDFFELFVASELLKSYDLSVDELEAGLVGGGNDGGIDGFYMFVDGEPLYPDSPATSREVNLELVIFQAKDSPSFTGTALDKMISTMNTLFDLGRDLASLRKLYNERLLERANSIRRFYKQNIARIVQFQIRAYYATRSEHVHDALRAQVSTLESAVQRLFPTCSFQFEFVGAQQLLTMARTQREEWRELKVSEGPLVVADMGYIGLVKLADYSAFVTDERGNRRRSLFLDNVRDYEGKLGVNEAIASTLRGGSPEDFWTLNNGVTLLASQVRPGYRLLALRDPKVVNGLQTSVEIFDYFKGQSTLDDNRTVLVRVVVPANEDSRDRIIVATNKQTPIATGVLHATDPIHKDIEEFLARHGLYYERRRNAYRNEGVSLDAIVTMPHLALCVTAVLLQEPHISVKINARSRVFSRPNMYGRIFSREYPLPAFLNCLRIVRYVESYIRQIPVDRKNAHLVGKGPGGRPSLWWTQWHTSMYVAAVEIEGRVSPARLAELDFAKIEALDLAQAIAQVRSVFKELGSRGTEYQLAKLPESTERLLALARKQRR